MKKLFLVVVLAHFNYVLFINSWGTQSINIIMYSNSGDSIVLSLLIASVMLSKYIVTNSSLVVLFIIGILGGVIN